MKHLKTLGLLTAAVAATMVFATSASANPSYATSPANTIYTGPFHASAGVTELHNAVTTIKCNFSTMAGNITADKSAGNTASGVVNTLHFSECNYPTTVLRRGSLAISSAGTTYSTGAEITIHGPFGVNCIYTTNGTDIGTLTGGKPAKLDIDSASIPRTGHSAFCGSHGTWTGIYTVNTPNPLFVS